MSEKLKPNFTPVPNVIFDEAMRTLAPGAVKLLFAICRYTYGWGKKSDRISLNQLSAMTGMDRANVARSVRQLGHLVIVTPGDPRTNQASEYRINVDISDSDLVSKAQQGLVSEQQQASVRPSVKTPPIQRKTKERERSESDKPIPSLHLFTNGASKNGVDEQLLNPPTKAKRKRARPVFGIPPELQPTISKIVAKINEFAGTHYHDNKPDALSELLARLQAGATEAECIAVVQHQWRKWGEDEKMRDNFNPVTLFRKSNFPRYLQNALRVQTGNSRGGFVG